MPCVQCTKNDRALHCSYSEYPPGAPSSVATQDVSHLEDAGRARKYVRSSMTEQQKETATPCSVSHTTLMSVPKLGIIENLQNRVEKLEHQLKAPAPNLGHIRGHEPDEDDSTKRYTVSSRGVVRLKNSATRYHGQNQKVALLNHVSIC